MFLQQTCQKTAPLKNLEIKYVLFTIRNKIKKGFKKMFFLCDQPLTPDFCGFPNAYIKIILVHMCFYSLVNIKILTVLTIELLYQQFCLSVQLHVLIFVLDAIPKKSFEQDFYKQCALVSFSKMLSNISIRDEI